MDSQAMQCCCGLADNRRRSLSLFGVLNTLPTDSADVVVEICYEGSAGAGDVEFINKHTTDP